MNANQEVQKTADQSLLGVGTWIGRGQAFGMLANKCSAAQAECLRRMRQERLYQRLGLTWEEFLERHAGITKSHANKLIRKLEEFGPAYFQLSEIVPVSPESYRMIAGSVRDGAIEIDGELVPIEQENAPRIRGLLEARRSKETAAQETRQPPKPSVPEVKQRLDACIRDLREIARSSPDKTTRMELFVLVGYWVEKLKEVSPV